MDNFDRLFVGTVEDQEASKWSRSRTSELGDTRPASASASPRVIDTSRAASFTSRSWISRTPPRNTSLLERSDRRSRACSQSFRGHLPNPRSLPFDHSASEREFQADRASCRCRAISIRPASHPAATASPPPPRAAVAPSYRMCGPAAARLRAGSVPWWRSGRHRRPAGRNETARA